MADLGARHAQAARDAEPVGNRYTKHLILVSLAGRILRREDWISLAEQGIRDFVEASLFPDGTSHDLKKRDTLTYHASALQPVLDLAMLSGSEGRSLYLWEALNGASIKKSVDYVVPFASGEKQRREWMNSTVSLDHARAEAGLKHYQRGRLFEPEEALPLLERAAFFDPSLAELSLKLSHSNASRLASWQMLLNAAVAADDASQHEARIR